MQVSIQLNVTWFIPDFITLISHTIWTGVDHRTNVTSKTTNYKQTITQKKITNNYSNKVIEASIAKEMTQLSSSKIPKTRNDKYWPHFTV